VRRARRGVVRHGGRSHGLIPFTRRTETTLFIVGARATGAAMPSGRDKFVIEYDLLSTFAFGDAMAW
jgi:hypothetical protein